MKRLVIIIIASFFHVNAFASGLISPAMSDCRYVEGVLAINFISNPGSIPKSFDEIELMSKAAHKRIEFIETINKLAVVPGAPLIQKEEGISNDCYNYRLFAINRIPNYDKCFKTRRKNA